MTRNSAKTPGQRQLRVGEELRHALAAIIARGELRDPDLADLPVTVTEVRMSPDLRSATAFAAPLGGGDATKVIAALRRAAPFLRRRIGAEMSLKFVPNLQFEEDRSFDYAAHIDGLLRDADDAGDADDANDADDRGSGDHGA